MKNVSRPGATPAVRAIGVVGTTPRFICHSVSANHTHLADYTRVASLPRVALAPLISVSASHAAAHMEILA